MADCPLIFDRDPPCISRCRVEGEYDENLPLSAVQDMLRQCVDSLSDWDEVTLDEALFTVERMALLLKGRVKIPPDALAKMCDVATGTKEALTGVSHPQLWEVYLRIGDVQMSCGDAEVAEDSYTEAFLLEDANVEVWNNLGLAKKRRGDVEGARESYERAVKMEPDYPQAWFNLGMLQFELEEMDGAKKAFMRVIRLDPANPVALNNLGVILRREGLLEEALKLFNRSLELLPDYAKAWHNKGITLVNLEREEQGVKCIYNALRLQPDLSDAKEELEKLGYGVSNDTSLN